MGRQQKLSKKRNFLFLKKYYIILLFRLFLSNEDVSDGTVGKSIRILFSLKLQKLSEFTELERLGEEVGAVSSTRAECFSEAIESDVNDDVDEDVEIVEEQDDFSN